MSNIFAQKTKNSTQN